VIKALLAVPTAVFRRLPFSTRERALTYLTPRLAHSALFRNSAVRRFYVESAHFALVKGEFARGLATWELILATWPDKAVGYRGTSGALRALGRLDRATDVIENGLVRFPDDELIIAEAAKVAQHWGKWQQAFEYWQRIVQRPGASLEWLHHYALALITLGHFDTLDTLLRDLRPRHPDFHGFLAMEALLEGARRNYDRSLELWREFQRRRPDDPVGWEHYGRIHQARELARLEIDQDSNLQDEASPVTGPVEIVVIEDEHRRDLLMSFESIGRDCEFGLVQRRFGAEPLGLLRFNAVSYGSLISALAHRFADMGAPETTELITQPNGEFFVQDRRWGLGMHTFVFQGQQAPETLYTKLCQRVKFLRDKLLSDLSEGRKIAVFNSADITEEELRILYLALRAIGPVTLLNVRPLSSKMDGWAGTDPGDVLQIEQALFVGYLRRSGITQALTWDIAFDDWVSICTKVKNAVNARDLAVHDQAS